MLHYASDPETNMIDLFNKEFEREFITNIDYQKVGGDMQKWTTQEEPSGSDKFKKYLKNHWLRPGTSVMGSFEE